MDSTSFRCEGAASDGGKGFQACLELEEWKSADSAKCSLFRDIYNLLHFSNVPLQAFSGEPTPVLRLCRNRKARERQSGSKVLECGIFYFMGNRRLYKAERILVLGTPESEHLEVTALNLFHPTTSPSFQRDGLFIL